MYKKLLLSIFLFGSLSQLRAQFVTQEMKARPADYEYLSAPDLKGIRQELIIPDAQTRSVQATQKLPYPILFIHGLDSNANVWGNLADTNDMHDVLTSYGLTFGGRFDFNLNDDNNNLTSNKLFYPIPGADIAQYSTTVVNADFYFLNFAVGSDGSFNPSNLSSLNVLSNEAAIAKQGVALKRAIQQILSITERDKVILFGHSMGGLCAREYLQNPSNWTEPNINHHVAKLITTGTPHNGYTGANFIITGINSSSEAYRDLRKEYSNNNLGAFLNGGIESSSYIGTSYYNNDINCNALNNDSSAIIGLNQKALPINEVDFAYVMGNCDGCLLSQGLIPGDGVVRLVNANLSNIYSNLTTPKNEFIYTSSAAFEIHSDLPKAINVNLQALDEPNHLWLAYGVEFDKIYKGFIYKQPLNGYLNDFDDYKFTVLNNNIVNILINNITSTTLMAKIFDVNGSQIGNTYSGNMSNPINISQSLSAGNYYLEIYTLAPTTTENIYSYNFTLSSSLSNPDFTSLNSLKIYPNPTTSKVFFDNTKSNFNDVVIFNYLGQEVGMSKFSEFANNQEIDLSSFASGVYVLKFSNQESSQSVKIIKD